MRRLVCVFAAALAAFTAYPAEAQSNDPGASSDGLHWLLIPALAGASDIADADVRVEALHRAAEALRQELAVRGGPRLGAL
jgi:hypothetical protein